MKKIAFITDTHFDEEFTADCGVDARKNWDTIIADLVSKKITALIFGGDIGTNSSHSYFFDSLKSFSFHLVLGNHDKIGEVSKFYSPHEKTGTLYYSFDEKYHRYLFLDTSSSIVNDVQLHWLKSQLETEKSVILLIHHPIIEVKTIIDKRYPLKNREELKSLLESTKKPITVFCGHYHTNDEHTENNIRQIVTQSASYQFEKNRTQKNIINSEFGYRIIHITKNAIKTEPVNFNTQIR